MRPTTRHPLLILLLPLLLVFGQQAALWHELSHFGAPAQSSNSSQQGKPATGDGVCHQCAGFAHLAGAIPATSLQLAIVAGGFIPLHLFVVAFNTTRPSLHRNRGPPYLL
jgi:hypothetical protein